MIHTGEQYEDSIGGGGVVYVDEDRVKEVTTHPHFKPLADVAAGIDDLQQAAETTGEMISLYDRQEVLKFLENQKRSQKCQ